MLTLASATVAWDLPRTEATVAFALIAERVSNG